MDTIPPSVVIVPEKPGTAPENTAPVESVPKASAPTAPLQENKPVTSLTPEVGVTTPAKPPVETPAQKEAISSLVSDGDTSYANKREEAMLEGITAHATTDKSPRRN